MHPFNIPIDRGAVPAHQQVRERIVALIREGVLKPGDKLPGEPELAQALGVSRMTANKAILALVAEGYLSRNKGKGTFVTEPTVELQRLGRCIIAIPDDPATAREDFYFGGLFWPLHQKLEANRLVGDFVRFTGGMIEVPDAVGLVAISPPERYIDDMLAFSRLRGPVVVLGANWDGFGIGMIDSDNELGAALAVNHLLDLGHRRILFVGAIPSMSNTRDRVRGFTRAMKARGVSISEEDVIMAADARNRDTGTAQRIADAIRSPGGPTAIFAAGAYLAIQVQSLAYQLGLRVPQDLSVVGYDDPPFLSMAYPPITTVRQPLTEMAEAAAETILERIATGDMRPGPQIFDPALVVRGSTESPPFQRRNLL